VNKSGRRWRFHGNPLSTLVKTTALLLAASLVANVALVAVFALRRPAPISSAASAPVAPGSARPAAPSDHALKAALASGEVAALEAAGVPADIARELALGRAFSRLADKMRSARTSDGKWWKQRDGGAASREQLLQMRREISDAMVAAFGEDLSSLGGSDLLAFLPAEKRDALRRITQDYDEMMARFSAGGLQLASDREKLRLLRAERDRDIAALLTPEERLAYEMRTSPTAAAVRARYGDGIETEDDYRKIYALQKAFDEKFPADAMAGRVAPEAMRERGEAQRQLQDEIRAALGDEKYAALRRATDNDLKNVESLVSRLNLPPTTTDRIATARDAYASESQRISGDTSMPPAQRRTQIQDLAARAKAELTRTLGNEAADAYAQRSPWVGLLQNGVAYSTSPQTTPHAAMMPAGQSVYPVLPAGATAGPTAIRQTVVSGGANADPAGGHGDLFFTAPVAPVVRDSVQVMTFSSSGGEAPAATDKRVMVPAPPAPMPKP
jgi:hypothetical protein